MENLSRTKCSTEVSEYSDGQVDITEDGSKGVISVAGHKFAYEVKTGKILLLPAVTDQPVVFEGKGDTCQVKYNGNAELVDAGATKNLKGKVAEETESEIIFQLKERSGRFYLKYKHQKTFVEEELVGQAIEETVVEKTATACDDCLNFGSDHLGLVSRGLNQRGTEMEYPEYVNLTPEESERLSKIEGNEMLYYQFAGSDSSFFDNVNLNADVKEPHALLRLANGNTVYVVKDGTFLKFYQKGYNSEGNILPIVRYKVGLDLYNEMYKGYGLRIDGLETYEMAVGINSDGSVGVINDDSVCSVKLGKTGLSFCSFKESEIELGCPAGCLEVDGKLAMIRNMDLAIYREIEKTRTKLEDSHEELIPVTPEQIEETRLNLGVDKSMVFELADEESIKFSLGDQKWLLNAAIAEGDVPKLSMTLMNSDLTLDFSITDYSVGPIIGHGGNRAEVSFDELGGENFRYVGINIKCLAGNVEITDYEDKATSISDASLLDADLKPDEPIPPSILDNIGYVVPVDKGIIDAEAPPLIIPEGDDSEVGGLVHEYIIGGAEVQTSVEENDFRNLGSGDQSEVIIDLSHGPEFGLGEYSVENPAWNIPSLQSQPEVQEGNFNRLLLNGKVGRAEEYFKFFGDKRQAELLDNRNKLARISRLASDLNRALNMPVTGNEELLNPIAVIAGTVVKLKESGRIDLLEKYLRNLAKAQNVDIRQILKNSQLFMENYQSYNQLVNGDLAVAKTYADIENSLCAALLLSESFSQLTIDLSPDGITKLVQLCRNYNLFQNNIRPTKPELDQLRKILGLPQKQTGFFRSFINNITNSGEDADLRKLYIMLARSYKSELNLHNVYVEANSLKTKVIHESLTKPFLSEQFKVDSSLLNSATYTAKGHLCGEYSAVVNTRNPKYVSSKKHPKQSEHSLAELRVNCEKSGFAFIGLPPTGGTDITGMREETNFESTANHQNASVSVQFVRTTDDYLVSFMFASTNPRTKQSGIMPIVKVIEKLN